MTFNVNSAIGYSWEAVGVVWLASFAFTKQTVRSQSSGGRLLQLALLLPGFLLLGSRVLGRGWLGIRFLPEAPALALAGLAVTVAGCLLAIWARLVLGSNWSGRATVKAGHELITSGPYGLARHPIYTGLLLAGVGTGLANGEWRCVVGMALIVVGFMLKISQEERLMLETFPMAYPKYRQRVKALIPGVL